MLPIMGKHAIFCWATLEFLDILKERPFDQRKRSFLNLHHMVINYWGMPHTRYEDEKEKRLKKHFGIDSKEYSTQAEALEDITRMIEWAYGEMGEKKSTKDQLTDEEEFLFKRLAVLVERFNYNTMDEQVRREEFSIRTGFLDQ